MLGERMMLHKLKAMRDRWRSEDDRMYANNDMEATGILSECADELDALIQERGPQPIDNAPKDGTWILAKSPDGELPAVVSWNNTYGVWMAPKDESLLDESPSDDRRVTIERLKRWRLTEWVHLYF